MANLVGVAVNFSGNVAYAKVGKGTFHSQGEQMNSVDLIWSVNDAESNIALGNIALNATLKQVINDMMTELPEVTFFDWDSVKGDGREAVDGTFHIFANYAFDDNTTWTISVRYDAKSGIQVIKPDTEYQG